MAPNGRDRTGAPRASGTSEDEQMRALRILAAVACFAVAVGATVGSEPDAIKSVTAAGGKLQYDKIAKKRVIGGVALSAAGASAVIAGKGSCEPGARPPFRRRG